MLIPLADVIRNNRLNVTGVVHVGAHRCDEAEAYQQARIPSVAWIEGDPQLIPRCERRARRFPGHRVIEAVVTDVDHGETVFHRANNWQSSSVLALGTHLKTSPDVHYVSDVTLPTRTLDSLAAEHGLSGNLLNIDTQGAEGMILAGATEFLRGVDCCYLEFSTEFVYRGCARLWELDDFLRQYEFVRTDSKLAGPVGWGDGAWISARVLG